MTPASVRRRGAAYLLDWADEPVVAVATAVWLARCGGAGIGLALAWAAWIAVQLRRQARTGQTTGQRVMRIAVLDAASGAPLGGRRTTLRWVARAVDTLVPVLWLRAACTPRCRTFADRVAGSLVVVVGAPERGIEGERARSGR